MAELNHRVLLAQRPQGLVREDDFTHDAQPIPEPGAGEVLLRTEWLGIAGTDEKCAWLVDDLGLDGAINHRTDDLPAKLRELCPKRVDVFFDNTGGPILDAVHWGRWAEITDTLGGWVADGKLRHRSHVFEGLESAPHALNAMFTGENIGKIVIRVGVTPSQ